MQKWRTDGLQCRAPFLFSLWDPLLLDPSVAGGDSVYSDLFASNEASSQQPYSILVAPLDRFKTADEDAAA